MTKANSLPIVRWNPKTHQKFPDMKTEGVANILSDALLDSGMEAPLSANIDEEAALAFYQLFYTYTKYVQSTQTEWSGLSRKQRQSRCPELQLDDASDQYGCLHHLVTQGRLAIPPGHTLTMDCRSSGSFAIRERSAYVELDLVFMPFKHIQEDKPRVGRPAKHGPNSQVVTFRLARFSASDIYTLSIKGSGLFLLQGNTDYALPSKFKTCEGTEGPDVPTELQMFVGAMKSPFTLLQSFAQTALTLNLIRPAWRTRLANIPPFLDRLGNEQIKVKGFTFTRYMDFKALHVKGVNIRQEFLRSLFLVYEVAKGNRKTFANNGMKSYKGIATETRFEDEGYQQILDDEQKAFQSKNQNSPDQDRIVRRHARSVSNIHSIRLTRSLVEKHRQNNSHYMTAIQFSVPKTTGRVKLDLDSKGADYLRDNCLKVRFSVFSRFLKDYRISNLQDLISYLCPDHKLETFRQRLDQMFHRVLQNYDYFYWVGMQWTKVVLDSDCNTFLETVEADDIPRPVKNLIKLWASEKTADTPSLHSLTSLVTRVYYPKVWAAQEAGTRSPDVEKVVRSRALKLRRLVLKRYGVDLNYARAFHVTVNDAFFASTLNNLQSMQGLTMMTKAMQRSIYEEARKVMTRLAVLHKPQKWNALALTMTSRQTLTVI